MRVIHRLSATLFLAAICLVPSSSRLGAQSDLDAFMQRVMERRDDNWRKLQQYVLDERERIEVRGPGGLPLWGQHRVYTWYVRDGFFIRSPVEFNGSKISEDDRLQYEARFLRREQLRERRARERGAASTTADAPPSDLDGLIRQSREPEFISSAYFLQFKFDQGQYAFVGPETLDGVETLKVEYYPTLLFSDNDRDRRGDRRQREVNAAGDQQVRSLINKGSRITLWIVPDSHQIVRYAFSNVDLDFFPAQWLVSVTGVEGTMAMGQAFPDVWLPDSLVVDVDLMFAFGPIDFQYRLEYSDYRQPEVTSTIRIPEAR